MEQTVAPQSETTGAPQAASLGSGTGLRGTGADEAAISDSAPVELLSFTMDGQFYAVDIMLVREIRGWSQPTPLPHAPDYMRGVLNLRGTVLPILDLCARLNGTPTEASARNVIIVVEFDDQIAGLLVDAVSDILTLKREDMQPPPDMPGERSENFIDSLTIVDGDMVRTLDMKALLKSASESVG